MVCRVRACARLPSLALACLSSVAAHLVRPMLALVKAVAAVREASVRSCARLLSLACERGRAARPSPVAVPLTWLACVRACGPGCVASRDGGGGYPSPPAVGVCLL
jgi:hypothetical protein